MPLRRSRSKRHNKKPKSTDTMMQKEKVDKAPEAASAATSSTLEANQVEVVGPAVAKTYQIIEEEFGVAGPAVANTYELAENILINLLARDLFRLQRVSKGFQSTIKRSENLKKKMWLLPVGEVATAEGDWDSPMNLPDTAFVPVLPVKLETGKSAQQDTADYMPMTATFTGSHLHRGLTDLSTLFGTILLHFSDKRDMSGTWQHMQLTQPPRSKLWLRADKAYHNFKVVENGSGITLGDVWRSYKELKEQIEKVGHWQEDEEILGYVVSKHAISTCAGPMGGLHMLGYEGNAPVYVDDQGCGWRKAFEE
ncbi:hypothetical protein PRZ48_009051 [Zasmidium cellare]|uniref:F-box domain-containing protein n=1 Tax=Zasmidium cellare TaxID=395010 RepID=A0ABR0EH97_ZASCE|nr:hypothetical protein PRZ48_009051 [Zasmidium cellare]